MLIIIPVLVLQKILFMEQRLELKADEIKHGSVQLAYTLIVLEPLSKEYTTMHPFVFKSINFIGGKRWYHFASH